MALGGRGSPEGVAPRYRRPGHVADLAARVPIETNPRSRCGTPRALRPDLRSSASRGDECADHRARDRVARAVWLSLAGRDSSRNGNDAGAIVFITGDASLTRCADVAVDVLTPRAFRSQLSLCHSSVGETSAPAAVDGWPLDAWENMTASDMLEASIEAFRGDVSKLAAMIHGNPSRGG